MSSFVVVSIGIVIVLGLIIGLRINAFIALIVAALAVSFLAEAPQPVDGAAETIQSVTGVERMARVGREFGVAAGKIGLVIGFAAVIGEAMMRSGAADRIVMAFLSLLGEKRAPWALMSSGFVLSVPVFFDTVFYLLVPLAKSLYQKTGKNFLLYVLSISAGGAITHTLVPPTPGPLAMASALDVSIGLMIVIGSLVALPAAVAGIFVSSFLDKRVKIASLENPKAAASEEGSPQQVDASSTVSTEKAASSISSPVPLWEALLPVLLPILLISGDTVVGTLMAAKDATPNIFNSLKPTTEVLGNPSMALLISMTIALITWVRWRKPSGDNFSKAVENALLSGGLVILITAAGGAFGAMLKVTGIAADIRELFAESSAVGLMSLLLAFGMASLLKIAQGSSTTAMITVSAMMASFGLTAGDMGFNMVYICTAIGAGSLMGSWMNDSGFWIVAKMSGLSETEALKTWTPLLATLAIVSLGITILLSKVLPMLPAAAA